MTQLIADFDAAAGFDFHQAHIDVPQGRYQFIYEVMLDTSDPIEVVRSYCAAIDDIHISPITCEDLCKCSEASIKFNIVFNQNTTFSLVCM